MARKVCFSKSRLQGQKPSAFRESHRCFSRTQMARSSISTTESMTTSESGASLKARDLARGWWRILNGHAPLMSIEITRECPLSCPGCYAYGDSHLGGEKTLRDLSDFRGDALVNGVLNLVRRHKPAHVSLVGGEPLVRHRELSSILPQLSG